jgi:hypothetical protein
MLDKTRRELGLDWDPWTTTSRVEILLLREWVRSTVWCTEQKTITENACRAFMQNFLKNGKATGLDGTHAEMMKTLTCWKLPQCTASAAFVLPQGLGLPTPYEVLAQASIRHLDRLRSQDLVPTGCGSLCLTSFSCLPLGSWKIHSLNTPRPAATGLTC